MMFDQLAGAAGGILDRLAVSRIEDAWGELDRPLERLEVVAERIRTAVRVEADGGRDRPQQMVAGDQDAVAQEPQLAVGMPRQLDHLPAGERAALVQEIRIERVLDERREHVTLFDPLVRDLRRRTVLAE